MIYKDTFLAVTTTAAFRLEAPNETLVCLLGRYVRRNISATSVTMDSGIYETYTDIRNRYMWRC